MTAAKTDLPYNLIPNLTHGSHIEAAGDGVWRLELPPGDAKHYRLAQMDDYARAARQAFPDYPPYRLKLKARASAQVIPGTWGFGFWNDPFNMGFLTGKDRLRLPALPNTAWFFFASPPNYLSLRDDLPAAGGLAATFRSPRLPGWVLAMGMPVLPGMLIPPAARLLRRLGRRFIRQDAVQLVDDNREWHWYEIDWQPEKVVFRVDEVRVLETATAPEGPLGLVIWVDNQYAALTPEGRLKFGVLSNQDAAWIEIADITLEAG